MITYFFANCEIARISYKLEIDGGTIWSFRFLPALKIYNSTIN